VAVFGCGCIGLGVINTAVQVGASRIIAIDVNPAKEKWAKNFGATDFVNPLTLKDQDLQNYLISITDGGVSQTVRMNSKHTETVLTAA
jgi:S-(hydroxymethyl)glutathione dehydrogenase/alcohol dehydrogenase